MILPWFITSHIWCIMFPNYSSMVLNSGKWIWKKYFPYHWFWSHKVSLLGEPICYNTLFPFYGLFIPGSWLVNLLTTIFTMIDHVILWYHVTMIFPHITWVVFRRFTKLTIFTMDFNDDRASFHLRMGILISHDFTTQFSNRFSIQPYFFPYSWVYRMNGWTMKLICKRQ